MKTFASIFLFILIPIIGISQEKPLFNFGVGYPFFSQKENYRKPNEVVSIESRHMNN